MSIWPVIVGLGILALAYILYRLLPEIIDFEMSFLWVIGIFLLIYIGAAIYLSYSIPVLSKVATPAQRQGLQTSEQDYAEEIIVEDRIERQ